MHLPVQTSSRRARRRGQGLVEFGLTMPLLIMFLSLGIDFGRYISLKLALEFAVHDAARYAVLRNPAVSANAGYPQDADVQTRFTGLYPNHLPAATVTVANVTVNGVSGAGRRVTASFTVRPVTPGMDRVLGNFAISASLTLPKRFPNPGAP